MENAEMENAEMENAEIENAEIIALYANMQCINADLLRNCLKNLEELPEARRWCGNLTHILDGAGNDRSVAYYLSARSALSWLACMETDIKTCLFRIREYDDTAASVIDLFKQHTIEVALALKQEMVQIEYRLQKILYVLESEKIRYQKLRNKVREQLGWE